MKIIKLSEFYFKYERINSVLNCISFLYIPHKSHHILFIIIGDNFQYENSTLINKQTTMDYWIKRLDCGIKSLFIDAVLWPKKQLMILNLRLTEGLGLHQIAEGRGSGIYKEEMEDGSRYQHSSLTSINTAVQILVQLWLYPHQEI